MALGFPAVAHADEAGLALMEASHRAYYYAGDGGKARVGMVLTDKKGRTRNREFWMLRRDVEDMGDQRYYTYFLQPADVARTAFLVHKKSEGNDDRWLYVPALDLVKRLAADDRHSSFVGSDFTYEDVSGRLPSLDEHEILGKETMGERAVTRVRSTPKDPKTAAYAYRVSWVDDATKLPLREDYFAKHDETVRRFEAGKIETVDGFPTIVERKMANLDTGHMTTIVFTEVSYTPPLEAKDYNERLLKNPPAEFTR
jgi:hypothetical protein